MRGTANVEGATFGGKYYAFDGVAYSKAEAEREKKRLQSSGFLVRIIKRQSWGYTHPVYLVMKHRKN
jgi:hypothetical protein